MQIINPYTFLLNDTEMAVFESTRDSNSFLHGADLLYSFHIRKTVNDAVAGRAAIYKMGDVSLSMFPDINLRSQFMQGL